MEKRTKELAATLETELLPKMQGGRWQGVSYSDKRLLLNIIAGRRAKLEKQQAWLKAEQEKNKKSNM